MHGTAPTTRLDIAERLADTAPRCAVASTRTFEPAEARVILDEFETSFGVCQALVTIEGTPEDWSITKIEVPRGVYEFSRFCETHKYDRFDWATVEITAGSFVEREIARAVREAISEDMATDAFRAEQGE